MEKFILCLLAGAVFTSLRAKAADPVYIRLRDQAQVILSDGTEFAVAKGECFPFMEYDREQVLVQLKLGDKSFWTRKNLGEFVPEGDAVAARKTYEAGAARLKAQEELAFAGGGDGLGDISARTAPPQRDPNAPDAPRGSAPVPVEKRNNRGIDSFSVDATKNSWQNSGVWVKAGQRVTVQANRNDRWDIGWGGTDANGYDTSHDPNAGLPVFHSGKANEDWRYGALICAVGLPSQINRAENQVEIGMKRSFMVDSDGYLYFICNDNPNSRIEFTDNSGKMRVRAVVADVPKTSSEAGSDSSPASSPAPSPAASSAEKANAGSECIAGTDQGLTSSPQ